MLSEQV
ncbi:hypothetical protein VTH06DRAFT_4765 [Thermothelomyces fergusii]